jgi:T-complex protein 1 subunit gamma
VRLYAVLFVYDVELMSSQLDTAQHVFERHNVSALRRVRKSDNNRIALAVGATIVNRIEDLRDSDIGTQCGLFNIEKIGDE